MQSEPSREVSFPYATAGERLGSDSHHTAGPWEIGTAHGTARDHAVVSGLIVVGKATGFGYPIGEGWHEQSAANARLMAAAPELLAALQAAVPGLETLSDADRAGWQPHLIAARAAIAKATGAPR